MAYKRETFTPSRHRKKTPPKNEDLIQKGNTIHAFLAKVNIPLSEIENNKENSYTISQSNQGYFNNEPLNIKKNKSTVSRFDLWITEANYGYSIIGPTAVSKYYTRSYSHSFRLTPANVKGVCRDENEYDDLGDFIREGQIAISQNPENLFRLYIPGAKIDYLGVIETFKGGFDAKNKGVPLAPKFEFDFTIFKDLNDNVQKFGTTARTIIYNFDTDAYWVQKFNDYKNDYIVGQLKDKILTDDSKNEFTGFNRGIGSIANAATDSAGAALETIYESVDTSINKIGEEIEKSFGGLF